MPGSAVETPTQVPGSQQSQDKDNACAQDASEEAGPGLSWPELLLSFPPAASRPQGPSQLHLHLENV